MNYDKVILKVLLICILEQILSLSFYQPFSEVLISLQKVRNEENSAIQVTLDICVYDEGKKPISSL
jgi:hypothetical protein